MASSLLRSLLCFLSWFTKFHDQIAPPSPFPVGFIRSLMDKNFCLWPFYLEYKVTEYENWRLGFFFLLVLIEVIEYPEKSFNFPFVLMLKIPRNLYPSNFSVLALL